jgi:hypothetical protein
MKTQIQKKLSSLKKSLAILLLFIVLTGCANPTATPTPSVKSIQIRYEFASNYDFCEGTVTYITGSGESKVLTTFPNGPTAEFTLSMKPDDSAFIQVEYESSTKNIPCDLICRIYKDDVLWKENKATGSLGTKVVCEGVVGE